MPLFIAVIMDESEDKKIETWDPEIRMVRASALDKVDWDLKIKAI